MDARGDALTDLRAARPGMTDSRSADIPIAIDRPRSLKDYASEAFNGYTSRIRELLGAETLA